MADGAQLLAPAAEGIGAPLNRIDGPAKVTGAARYAYEQRPEGDALYGVLVSATVGKGWISHLDVSGAEAAPGVALVMTYRNAPKQAAPGPVRFDDALARPKPLFVDDQVLWHGQPVALVVADTLQHARAAALLVEVAYDAAEDGRFDFGGSLEAAETPKPTALAGDSLIGDFDAAFAGAAVTLDEVYTTPNHAHCQMEPHASTAEWKGGQLLLHTSHQIVSECRRAVAATLCVDAAVVRIVSRYVGGGFGGKLQTYADAIGAALAAKVLKQPVKVALTRPQVFEATCHRPESRQRVRLGADAEGRLAAYGHDSITMTAAVEEFTESTASFGRHLYAAPARRTTHQLVRLDLPVAFAMRAPGEAIGMLGVEVAMDELAERLGLDPIELRRRNEPEQDPERGVPFSSRKLLPCLEEGAARFGWAARAPKPRMTREGDWWVGQGVSAAIRNNYMRPARCRARLGRDGVLTVEMDMTDIGTGSYTIFTQIAADRFGVRAEDVQVRLGDSDLPLTPGSGGSFGAISAGAAAQDAVEALKRRVAQAAVRDPASPLEGADPAALVFREGAVYADNVSEPIRDIAARLPLEGLEAEGAGKPTDAYQTYSQHSYGAHFAEVAVHRWTGEVRLRRMLGVFAAGRIFNPKTARSQLVGGMINGVGAALTEAVEVETRRGAFLNNDLAEYLLPTNGDAGMVDAVLLEDHDAQANSFGAKGVGELGICGAGAAVANAIHHACGARLRDYPMTLDKVLAAMPRDEMTK